jgi:translation initiation factor 2B subunit (eIF-2B alpha/beta/delta family)
MEEARRQNEAAMAGLQMKYIEELDEASYKRAQVAVAQLQQLLEDSRNQVESLRSDLAAQQATAESAQATVTSQQVLHERVRQAVLQPLSDPRSQDLTFIVVNSTQKL